MSEVCNNIMPLADNSTESKIASETQYLLPKSQVKLNL